MVKNYHKKLEYQVTAILFILMILSLTSCSNSFKFLDYIDGTEPNVNSSEDEVEVLDPINKILTLTPENPTITTLGTVNFSAADGTPPYQYYITEGPGNIDINTGEYSPTIIGKGVIRAVDNVGKWGETKIEVTAGAVVIDADG